MKSVARMSLTPGMVLGEDIYSYKNELILPADTVLSDSDIAKLARHSIMCVTIKEAVDLASTHYEKVRVSDDFQNFEQVYNKYMPIYKNLMNGFVENGTPVSIRSLMGIHHAISTAAPSGEKLLDFLYNMLPSEDNLTHAHCLNSALIAGVFGKWCNLTPEDLDILIQSAFFYDIGKLKLPYELIWKPEKLSDVEFEQIKTHTMLGFDMLKDMNLNQHILNATLMHHERNDGSGYPSRLKGKQIDRFAKYIAIIDSYEAMTSPRTYRQSLNPYQIIDNFEKQGFVKYDLEFIIPILTKVAESQVGYTALLNDGRKCRIEMINSFALSRPYLYYGEELIDLSKEKDLFIQAII